MHQAHHVCQITLAFVSLYNIIGWPAFVGVAIMVISIPLNTYIARIMKKLQQKQMKNRDKRTRLMSELLGNIRRCVELSPQFSSAIHHWP